MKRVWLAVVTLVFGSLYLSNTLSAQNISGPKPEVQAAAISCPAPWVLAANAGWEFCWENTLDHGIEIGQARFNGKSVFYSISQPFVLVPYQGHDPRYKDGLRGTASCGGTPYKTISGPTAAWLSDDDNPGYPASSGYPAAPAYTMLVVSGIYDSVFYRYRQVFKFHGNGDVELLYGFGGFLPGTGKPHFHSPYWRIDLDVDVNFPNYFEQFNHPAPPPIDLGLNGPDTWVPVTNTGGILGDPSVHQKWRVRSDTVNSGGQFHSWEIEKAEMANSTEYSTYDVWPTILANSGDGSVVGAAGCDDREIQTIYSNGGLDDISAGADLVVWAQATHYHEPRFGAEETPRMPGFEYVGLKLRPRGFENSTPTN